MTQKKRAFLNPSKGKKWFVRLCFLIANSPPLER